MGSIQQWFMYAQVTHAWDDNFRDIKKVAEMIRARGRWGRGAALGK